MNLTNQISAELDKQVKIHGKASLVVCGGSSPLNLFEELSRQDINWAKIVITLCDDRLVHRSHKDSNEALIRNELIINHAKKAKFIPLIQKNLGKLRPLLPFTTMILGMGNDGHFASIFPTMIKDPEVIDEKASPQLITTEPLGMPKHPRITMNLAMILQSNSIYLLINNIEKDKTFKLSRNDSNMPLKSLVEKGKGKLRVCFDVP